MRKSPISQARRSVGDSRRRPAPVSHANAHVGAGESSTPRASASAVNAVRSPLCTVIKSSRFSRATRSRASRTSASSSSRPTQRQPLALAASTSTRPSPHPRSYRTSEDDSAHASKATARRRGSVGAHGARDVAAASAHFSSFRAASAARSSAFCARATSAGSKSYASSSSRIARARGRARARSTARCAVGDALRVESRRVT